MLINDSNILIINSTVLFFEYNKLEVRLKLPEKHTLNYRVHVVTINKLFTHIRVLYER